MPDAKELNLDVSAEGARALHRVVRAMHDGHCPNCGFIAPSTQFYNPPCGPAEPSYHLCPNCRFLVTEKETAAALELFRPYFLKSVEVFKRWREGKPLDDAGRRGVVQRQ